VPSAPLKAPKQEAPVAAPAKQAPQNTAAKAPIRKTKEQVDDERIERLKRRFELIPHGTPNVFRFALGPAILAQVLEELLKVDLQELGGSHSHAKWPGFYQLLLKKGGDPKPVYVGRTIRPIRARLQEHKKRLRGRIRLDEVLVRYVFVEDLSLVGMSEDNLIAFFQPKKMDEWGTSGFGSKATGANRGMQASKWDVEYPPNLTLDVEAGSAAPQSLRKHIMSIASGAPITFSMSRGNRAKCDAAFPDLLAWKQETMPFEDWAARVSLVLESKGWEIDRQPMAWYAQPSK